MRTLVLLWIVAFYLVGCGQSPTSVVKRSKANRESFDNVYCEFTITAGRVKNAADEDAGRLSETLGKATGYYAKRGDQEIIVIQDNSIPDSATKPDKVLLSPVFLRTSKHEFMIYGGASSASINAIPPHKLGCDFDPWYLDPWARTGWLDEAAMTLIEKDKRAEPALKMQGNEAQVVCKSMGGLIFTFDASKNYLAIAMGNAEVPKAGMRVLEATQHGSNYFPKVKFNVDSSEEFGEGKPAYRWEATKTEFGQPTEAQLQYRLASDVEVSLYMEVKAGHVLEKGEMITPDSLADIFNKTKAPKRP